MSRKYNSRRRTESATHTRQAIVEAAVKLHGEGITALSAVAEKAGVSLPTVSKYFPTREALFDACTSHVAVNLDYPAPETFKSIEDSGERLRRVVYEVYRLHEEILGQLWLGYKLEDESPALARAILEAEAFVSALAETLPYDNAISDQDTAVRFVQAALNPLTYRAMRLRNGLSFEEAVTHMTHALAGVLNIRV